MGRVTSSSQVTDGVTYPMPEYRYDLAGNLTSQRYPSGRVVTTGYDSAGRLNSVDGQKAGEATKTYASGVSYTAAGAVTDLQLGNGLWEQTLYNTRLQPTGLRLGTTPGGSNRLNLTYAYGTANNNGNVQSQTITVPTVGTVAGFTATQSYTYDALNRLESAEELNGSTQVWKQSYQYDRYGNRTIDTGLDQNSNKKTSDNVKPVLASDNPTLNLSTNQININQGYGYEGAGNLISVPNRNDPAKSYQYEYDAENRQVSFDKEPATPNTKDATYVYDGDGRRVKKIAEGITTVFVYDIGGKLVAEYSSAGSAGGGTSYVTSDALGTPRVITGSNINDASGGVKARHDYLPFGEELFIGRSSYAGDSVRQKFTGKERDSETGLDYFHARYYSSAQGRFTSPDLPFADQHQSNPQSWNLYPYVRNSPCNNIDPNGRCSVPSGLKEGSVGICIEAFIANPTLGPLGLARGDNRTFNGSNKELTARVRVDVILTATDRDIHASVTPTPGVSHISTGAYTVSNRDKSTGETVTAPTSIGLLGTAEAKAELSTDAVAGVSGFGNNTRLTVTGSGINGVTKLGYDLVELNSDLFDLMGVALLAASPKGEISFKTTFQISGTGDVKYIEGVSKGYPSYAAYSYRYVNGKLITTELFKRQENEVEDLNKPMTPIR
jgi:RHS repeat-associated protein